MAKKLDITKHMIEVFPVEVFHILKEQMPVVSVLEMSCIQPEPVGMQAPMCFRKER